MSSTSNNNFGPGKWLCIVNSHGLELFLRGGILADFETRCATPQLTEIALLQVVHLNSLNGSLELEEFTSRYPQQNMFFQTVKFKACLDDKKKQSMLFILSSNVNTKPVCWKL